MQTNRPFVKSSPIKPASIKPASIKPIEQAHLPLLEEWFPEGGPTKHAERLTRQERDEVIYLFAWVEEQPVGHCLLKWHGIGDEATAALLQSVGHLAPIPDIEDFFVFRSLRSQGIGAQILKVAENLALGRGHHQMGLSVGVDNGRAQRLYQRFGFRDSGVGQFVERGSYTDRLGQEQSWSETCIYLIKPLHGSIDNAKPARSAP